MDDTTTSSTSDDKEGGGRGVKMRACLGAKLVSTFSILPFVALLV